jgi:hypothetical protein
LNENHGHVIVEAWQAGLPVIISDQTPWHGLVESRSGWDLLLNPRQWIDTVQHCVDMDEVDYSEWRCGALAKARVLGANPPLNEWRLLLDWASDRVAGIHPDRL